MVEQVEQPADVENEGMKNAEIDDNNSDEADKEVVL